MLFKFNCDPRYFSNNALFEIAATIDFSELKQPPILEKIDGETGAFTMEVPDDEVREMQGLINEDIVGRGMDNQNTVNETGKMLYWLYDEILYQKKK